MNKNQSFFNIVHLSQNEVWLNDDPESNLAFAFIQFFMNRFIYANVVLHVHFLSFEKKSSNSKVLTMSWLQRI